MNLKVLCKKQDFLFLISEYMVILTLDEKYYDNTDLLKEIWKNRRGHYVYVSDLLMIIPPVIDGHYLNLEWSENKITGYYRDYDNFHDLHIRYSEKDLAYVLYRLLKLIHKRPEFKKFKEINNVGYIIEQVYISKRESDVVLNKLPIQYKGGFLKISYLGKKWIGSYGTLSTTSCDYELLIMLNGLLHIIEEK